MCRMRRGLVHAAAWSLATGAAVTLSWWGVHTVMAGTAYDPPRALPIAADSPPPQSSSTHRPRPPESPAPTRSAAPPAARTPSGKPQDRSPAAPPRPRPRPPAAHADPAPDPDPHDDAAPAPGGPPATDTGEVRSYAVDGGRVAFALGTSAAELVSATPASGWRMQVWKQPTYIRVTFSRDGRETDVFSTWHDQSPTVLIERR
ncbi:hypothetical protein NX801_19140 [Streptomyces sp. LP05-1]|uniref:Secreted protein n=1 Tax=Streptomyces pyxinae TaxID=2970734 RepID=A0ABT2CKY4_9ACTN|nr:hypothetical protein [Streptomyces sp. LP05-1]MCS0637742.1 hypothetical protein [Streptomyces sp. LP05-1]